MKSDIVTCLEFTASLFAMVMVASNVTSIPISFKGFAVLFCGIMFSILAGLKLYKILNWEDFQ